MAKKKVARKASPTKKISARKVAPSIKAQNEFCATVFDKITEKVVPFKVENVKVTKGGFGF